LNDKIMANLHPDLDLMTDFSAGTLPLALAACVSVHVSDCAHCRKLTERLTQVGVALFEKLDPQAVSDTQLDKVLARLEEKAPLEYPRIAEGKDTTPAILQRLMSRDFSDLTWKKIGSSLRISYLRTGDPSHEIALYHIKAGGHIPEHTHRGNEMTLVLTGGFSDSEGSYDQGDFIYRKPGDVHAPTAVQSEDCICLAVLDAPLKFTGWKFRWMNPFLKLRTA
jgi:putative transcriptional regulator